MKLSVVFLDILEEALRRAEPMQSESQSAETQISNQKIEIETLKKENLMWRQRANQLIEKNHVSFISFLEILHTLDIKSFFLENQSRGSEAP